MHLIAYHCVYAIRSNTYIHMRITYLCINCSLSCNIFLLDPNPPMVTTSPPSPIQDTVVGNSQSIDCIATVPVPVDVNLLTFTWINPQSGVITNDSRITIHPTISLANMYNSSLQFAHLLISDGGVYSCNVDFFNVTGIVTVVLEDPDCECVLYK